jgi:hypothetical protein
MIALGESTILLEMQIRHLVGDPLESGSRV